MSDPNPTSSMISCPRCGKAQSPKLMVGGLCAGCVARTMQQDFFSHIQPGIEEREPLSVNVQGYEIQELIGGGGMGEVYRAILTARGRVVAMKVVSGRLTRDPEVTARFEAEVAALYQLSHNNVVRVFDHGETANGRHFLVMEYVDGCDLGRLLRAQRLDMERALDIFLKVCAGVTHAHKRGLIHRDIKPANILIGADGTVKVADFGLAKTLVETSSEYNFTQTRDTFGTPYYVAPEVTRCEGKADVKADVYALGVLLYELLTGVLPMGQFTPLSVKTGLNKRVDAIVCHALADDPQRRLGSVEELAEAVRKIAEDHRKRYQKKARSRKLLTLAAVVLVMGMGVAVGSWVSESQVVSTVRALKSRPPHAKPNQPWENSLGMKLVPVPGTHVLFAVYETRVRDYTAFAKIDRETMPDWRASAMAESHQDGGENNSKSLSTSWANPGFDQSPDHPACGISQLDARFFCAWLTSHEMSARWIEKGQAYRLPTDEEWSVAAGLASDPGPYVKSNFSLEPTALPVGNFAGPEARRFMRWPSDLATNAPEDAFPCTAPAGSFAANAYGLFDMHGNVSEWTETRLDDNKLKSPNLYCLRGGSWATGQFKKMMPEARHVTNRSRAQPNFGFRIVLDLDAAIKAPYPLDPLDLDE